MSPRALKLLLLFSLIALGIARLAAQDEAPAFKMSVSAPGTSAPVTPTTPQ